MSDTIFTENDYRILKAIIDRNNDKKGLCIGNGTTIKEILSKTSLSDKKIRLTIKKFLDEEMISEGASIVKAKTYILTKKGLLELKKLRLNILEVE